MFDTTATSRLVSRHIIPFLMESAVAQSKPHDGDIVTALVFTSILVINANASGAGTGSIEALRDYERPASAHAVAESTGIPYETVRTRVNDLVKRDWCRRRPEGLFVVPEVFRAEAQRSADQSVVAAFLQGLDRLQKMGFDLIAFAQSGTVDPSRTEAPSTWSIARIINDYQLKAMEFLPRAFGSLMRGYVFGGILAANVRHLLDDPEAAWHFAALDNTPPDEVRRPVSIRNLTRQMGLPLETVRRQVKALQDLQAVKSSKDGVWIPSAIFAANPEQDLFLSNQLRRTLITLSSLGVSFHQRG